MGKTNKIILLILSMILMLSSCDKDDEPVNSFSCELERGYLSDGVLYYDITSSSTAKVVDIDFDLLLEDNFFVEIVNIPNYVEYRGQEYKVTSIGYAVFAKSYPVIKVIKIPNSVTTIGEGAFKSFSLADISISNSVKSIEKLAFNSCSSITNVVIPNSIW